MVTTPDFLRGEEGDLGVVAGERDGLEFEPSLVSLVEILARIERLCLVTIPSAPRIRYLARLPTQDAGDPEVGLGGGVAVAITAR